MFGVADDEKSTNNRENRPWKKGACIEIKYTTCTGTFKIIFENIILYYIRMSQKKTMPKSYFINVYWSEVNRQYMYEEIEFASLQLLCGSRVDIGDDDRRLEGCQ